VRGAFLERGCPLAASDVARLDELGNDVTLAGAAVRQQLAAQAMQLRRMAVVAIAALGQGLVDGFQALGDQARPKGRVGEKPEEVREVHAGPGGPISLDPGAHLVKTSTSYTWGSMLTTLPSRRSSKVSVSSSHPANT
jgi:hypothetical protein